MPADVGQVTLYFTNGPDTWSVSHWVLVPNAAEFTNTSAQFLLQFVEQDVSGVYLSMMGHNWSISACRLLLQGIPYLRSTVPNYGVHIGAEAIGVAATLHWRGLSPRDGWRALTHVSAIPSAWVDGDAGLNTTGLEELTFRAEKLLFELNQLPCPNGELTTMVLLRRRADGAPLEHAIVTPVETVTPSLVLTTIRRRMPKSRRTPPVAFPPSG